MLAVEFNDNQEQASAEANNEPTTFDIFRSRYSIRSIAR